MDGQVNLDGYERSPHKIFCSKKKDPIVFFLFYSSIRHFQNQGHAHAFLRLRIDTELFFHNTYFAVWPTNWQKLFKGIYRRNPNSLACQTMD